MNNNQTISKTAMTAIMERITRDLTEANEKYHKYNGGIEFIRNHVLPKCAKMQWFICPLAVVGHNQFYLTVSGAYTDTIDMAAMFTSDELDCVQMPDNCGKVPAVYLATEQIELLTQKRDAQFKAIYRMTVYMQNIQLKRVKQDPVI